MVISKLVAQLGALVSLPPSLQTGLTDQEAPGLRASSTMTHGSGGSGTAGLLNNDTFSLVTSNSPANILYLTGDRSITQTIGETVANNLSLQLSFKVGVRNAGGTPLPTDFEAGLYTTGGAELQKATIAQVAGGTLTSDLKTVSIQFDAGVGHGQIGQAIEVRLISTTGNTPHKPFSTTSPSPLSQSQPPTPSLAGLAFSAWRHTGAISFEKLNSKKTSFKTAGLRSSRFFVLI